MCLRSKTNCWRTHRRKIPDRFSIKLHFQECAARSKRHGRLGLFHQANPLISVQKVLIIHAVQRIELVLGAHAAIQRLAVAPELDILQAAGNAAIPVGVEGVEGGFQDPDIGRPSASLFFCNYVVLTWVQNRAIMRMRRRSVCKS